MPPVSMLIKPASSLCNLRCKYCFYHSIAEIREVKSYGVMEVETLETLVRKVLEYADYNCTFAFQGGEPTLAGLSFFEKYIEFVKKYNVKKVTINNALQTNGMVIDDQWAKFLHDNGFLVGLSLDGPKDIHDSNRVDTRDKGSFMRVMKSVELFTRYKVEYNILTVVNAYNAGCAGKIYNFYKKNGLRYLQFIPCLDSLDKVPGGNPYSLKPDKYAAFLKDLFDLWYKDAMDGNMVSIRYFDNLVGMLLGYAPEACGMSGTCSCQFVVEADGGVYPCDFYVTDEWYMGNLREMGLEELKGSQAALRFVEGSRPVDPNCRECKWYNLCRGGCRRNREPFNDGQPGSNYFCHTYKEFFEYAGDRLIRIADILSARRQP